MQGKILCNKLKVRNNENDMAKSASKLKIQQQQQKQHQQQRARRLKFITSREKNKFKTPSSTNSRCFSCSLCTWASERVCVCVCVWARSSTYTMVEFYARMWRICESGDVSFSSMFPLLFRSMFFFYRFSNRKKVSIHTRRPFICESGFMMQAKKRAHTHIHVRKTKSN